MTHYPMYFIKLDGESKYTLRTVQHIHVERSLA
jgi:hypothetical protein